MKTVCAWCFPGLLVIDGDTEISHGVCAKHAYWLQLSVFAWSVGEKTTEHYANQRRSVCNTVATPSVP